MNKNDLNAVKEIVKQNNDTLIGVIIGLNTELKNELKGEINILRIDMNQKFEQVDKRFEQVDNKFKKIDNELKDIKTQLKSVKDYTVALTEEFKFQHKCINDLNKRVKVLETA